MQGPEPIQAGRFFVILGGGDRQVRPVVEARRAFGNQMEIVVVDRNPEAPARAQSHRALTASIRDVNSVAAAVSDFAPRMVGIVSAAGGDAETVASVIRAEHGLLGPSPHAVAMAHDKNSLIAAAQASGIASPRQFNEAPPRSWAQVPFPLVVKPARTEQGKAEVRLAHDRHELASMLLSDALIEVEEFVPGLDLTLIGRVVNGRLEQLIAVDEHVGTRPDGELFGLGYGYPPRGGVGDGWDVLAAVVRMLEVHNSAVTANLRLRDDGTCALIEVHLELGGDSLGERLLPHLGFVDPFAWLMVPYVPPAEPTSSGTKPSVPAPGHHAMVFLYAWDPLDDARLRRVRELCDDHLWLDASGSDRVGALIVTAATRDRLRSGLYRLDSELGRTKNAAISMAYA